VFGPLPDQLADLSDSVLELTLLQATARTESVMLLPLEIDAETAFETARAYRRDWMNARANLVDTWRDIKVVADALQSDLDIIFEGDIANTGDNPLRLQSSTGRLRASARFDAPLTRLEERNNYREVLIQYQRARREYMAYEDQVAQGLRDIIRNIELSQVNFELRRAAVRLAIRQVELTQLRLHKPPKPGEKGQVGATTARDLVESLTELLTVQNDFMGVWISYQALRRLIDLDMGTMQLDPEGIWVDPGPIRLSTPDDDLNDGLERIQPAPPLPPPPEDGVADPLPSGVRPAGYLDVDIPASPPEPATLETAELDEPALEIPPEP
jgi:hypothetical protein